MTNYEQQHSPVEIERKFIAKPELLPGSPDDYEHATIRQGYLVIGSDGSEARLRDKAGVYSLTVKTRGDLVRGEWETEINQSQFDILWPATIESRIEKTRFKVPHGEYIVEVDIYEGELEGLVTAEVEFVDEASAMNFEVPIWLGEDVTKRPEFKNQALAKEGVPNE